MAANRSLINEIDKFNSRFFERFMAAAGITITQVVADAEQYNKEVQKFKVRIDKENFRRPIDISRIRTRFLFFLMDKYKIEFYIDRPSIHFGQIENLDEEKIKHFYKKSVPIHLQSRLKRTDPKEFIKLFRNYYSHNFERYVHELTYEKPLTEYKNYKHRYSAMLARIYKAVTITHDNVTINQVYRQQGFDGVTLSDYYSSRGVVLDEPHCISICRVFTKPLITFDIGYRWMKLSSYRLKRKDRVAQFRNKFTQKDHVMFLMSHMFMKAEIDTSDISKKGS